MDKEELADKISNLVTPITRPIALRLVEFLLRHPELISAIRMLAEERQEQEGSMESLKKRVEEIKDS